MLLTSLALAVLSQSADVLDGPELDRKISVTQVAEPLSVALSKFSLVAQVKLSAEKAMRAEVLLLRLDQAPLRETLKRVATACGGEWTKKGDGYELVRPPGFEEKCRTKLAAARAELIRKNLVRFLDKKANRVPLTPEAADDQIKRFRAHYAGPQPGSRTSIDPPSENYFSQIFTELDPAMLARASLDGRFVASDRPNSAERALDIDLNSPFQAYQADEAVFLDRLKAANMSEVAHPLVASGLPRVVLLIDDSLDDHQSMGIFLVVANSDGNALATNQAYFSMYWSSGSPLPSATPTPEEHSLKLSAENTKLLKSAMTYVQNLPVQPPIPDAATIERIKLPDHYEPLGGYVSEFMIGAAESQHLNLVADVPDMYLDLVKAACSNGFPSGAGLLRSLKGWPKEWSPITVDNKWLEVDGGQMQGYWAPRANRQDLADLFRSWKGGSLPISALANYAAKEMPRSQDFVGSQQIGILTGSEVSLDENTLEPLGLLARLSHQFGSEIINSGLPETPFGKLEPEVRDFAISLIYSKRFQAAMNGDSPGRRGASAPQILPEEVFGNESNPDAVVSVRAERAQAVLMRAPGQPERTTTVADIAFAFYQRDHQKSQAQLGDQLAATSYALANSTQVRLTLRVDQYHVEYSPMIEHDAKNSEFVPYEIIARGFQSESPSST